MHGYTSRGAHRGQIDLSSSNVQWRALVIVPHVDVHTSLDVAPHEGHVAGEDALAEMLCH